MERDKETRIYCVPANVVAYPAAFTADNKLIEEASRRCDVALFPSDKPGVWSAYKGNGQKLRTPITGEDYPTIAKDVAEKLGTKGLTVFVRSLQATAERPL